MQFPRTSGVLLPVFSLPGRFGIGDFGPSAQQFVRFLQQSGQSIWQLLPLGPTAKGNSPYSSYSAFAGNLLYISPELLQVDGLLTEEDCNAADLSDRNPHHVDYPAVRETKRRMIRTAFETFQHQSSAELRDEFESFSRQNSFWLDDFALFEALREDLQQPDWSRWDISLVHRNTDALQAAADRLQQQIQLSRFTQFIFSRQWHQLKEFAHQLGVRLYGDMPIFVAYESVDVWVHQTIFHLDSAGRPTVIAGVPPDYFSATGQMWGNPLYDWDRLKETNFKWWTERFRQAFEWFDILRIDHFRGFESYWEIPADARTAIEGQWKPGPGEAPFHAAQEALGTLPIVAEDLGLITDDVHALRDRLNFPGMRVLQFGFATFDDDFHRPHTWPKNSVAYTGTHDNDTVMGWYHREIEGGNPVLQQFVADAGSEPHVFLCQAVLNSAADTAILPMQDLLALGSDARINTPGLPDGNWDWRCSREAINDVVAGILQHWTREAGRLPA